jgi:putative colanic acid biosynthesis acetyltransferase WcaF
MLDSDLPITPELREEIFALTARPPEQVREAGFYVNRYLIFMGQRIRHCGYFPSWNLRLFKRGMARYEDRPVHEHMIVNGPEGYLRGLMEHEDRRGLEYYIAKHNRYSTLEAEAIFHGDRQGQSHLQPALFGGAIQRRRYLKTKIYPKLPARGAGRFFWMYLLELGFLDGRAGLRLCLLISAYELFTSLKLRELRRRAREGGEKVGRERKTEDRSQKTEGGGDSLSAAGYSSRATPALPAAYRLPPTSPLPREQLLQQRSRSPWSFTMKVRRVLWMVAGALLFRTSFHNWYPWRSWLLRRFGARIGRGVRIRPTVKIEMPWNLSIDDHAAVGDYAILYSLGPITIGRHAVISQYAHLCAGTHDYHQPDFPLICPPITIGPEVWVAADAFVGPDVTIGERAVVGARATVMKDVPPGDIVAGNPARVLKKREE